MVSRLKRKIFRGTTGKLGQRLRSPVALLPEVQIRRFWGKVSPEPNSGCWLWDGKYSHNGYGIFLADGSYRTAYRAHRFSYEYHVGPIPEGLDVDHLCRVRCCVNPAHLEPVTRKENIRRGLTGQAVAERNRSKTHCPRGHPYSGENLIINSKGNGRICRQCRRIANRKSKARRRKLEKLRAAEAAIAALVLFVFVAAPLPAEAHGVVCYPDGLEAVLDRLERKFHEKPVGLGTSRTGALAVLTLTQSGDGWSLIVATPNGQACMLDSGHNWESLKPLVGPQT